MGQDRSEGKTVIRGKFNRKTLKMILETFKKLHNKGVAPSQKIVEGLSWFRRLLGIIIEKQCHTRPEKIGYIVAEIDSRGEAITFRFGATEVNQPFVGTFFWSKDEEPPGIYAGAGPSGYEIFISNLREEMGPLNVFSGIDSDPDCEPTSLVDLSDS